MLSRSLIWPSVQTTLAAISQAFAQIFLQQVGSSSSNALASISTTAPQILMEPISYTIDNLRPFDIPVYVASISGTYFLTGLVVPVPSPSSVSSMCWFCHSSSWYVLLNLLIRHLRVPLPRTSVQLLVNYRGWRNH